MVALIEQHAHLIKRHQPQRIRARNAVSRALFGKGDKAETDAVDAAHKRAVCHRFRFARADGGGSDEPQRRCVLALIPHTREGDESCARLHEPVCRANIRRVQRAGQQLLTRHLRRELLAGGKRIRCERDSAEDQHARHILLHLR